MPLPLLLALVICGIAGIALLLHLLGLSTPRRLDADAARAAWLREFPDTDVTGITLCEGGTAALVATDAGPGVVWAMGADTTARPLGGATLHETPTGLSLQLADFTAPRLALRLPPGQAAALRAALAADTPARGSRP